MTVVIGDVLRFVAKGVTGGDAWNWVWHQKVTAGTSETDLTDKTGWTTLQAVDQARSCPVSTSPYHA